MKKLLLLLLSFIFIGCSVASTRIDNKYDDNLRITTSKSEKEIAQKIILLANQNGFEQKIINLELGYIQYRTPMTLTTYPMEVTILITKENDINVLSISAMNADKNSLLPLAKSQVKRAIGDFVTELKNQL